MAAPPSAQDVADALAITLERDTAAGAPWCPPRDAALLRRWITDRSGALGGGIRRVVRLARLMAVADGGDYTRFLYVRLAALRARHFRSALQVAAAEGRLPAGVATLSDTGVILREPALASQRGDRAGFEIDFAQMPRLAALLDFLHNSLGFGAVADVLAPVLQPALHAGHDDVARAMHAAINAWLGARLESANHLRQAQRIRAFLASRGRVMPEAIDDEAILLFWMTMAADGDSVEGFRLYRSVACALLRYRQALRDAAAAGQLEASLHRGQLPAAEAELTIDRESEAAFEPWRSPLGALISRPAGQVKWFTKKEQQRLFNYLGGAGGDEDDEDAADEGAPWQGGLAGDERFDLGFRLTLLRADVFGLAQASIVARLRKSVSPEDAIAPAMAAIDDAAYIACATAYAAVREQLRLECLAALAALMGAGAAEALILLGHFGGRPAVESVLGSAASGLRLDHGDPSSLDAAVRRDIAPVLKSAIAAVDALPESATRDLLLEARGAARRVNRIGFRRDDCADAGMLAALQLGAAAVVEVMYELDRLMAVLAQKAPVGDVPTDRARFLATFRRIYLSPTDG